MTSRLIWTAHAVAAAAVVAPSVPLYGGYFGSSAYLPWLAGSAALGALSGLLAFIRRWRTWALALASVIVLYLYLVLGPYRATGLPLHAPRAAISGLAHGLSQMLTTSTPADALPNLLAVPIAVTWLGAAAAAMLAIRTHAPLVPLLPGLICFLTALGLTANRAAEHLTLTAGWILLALVTVAIRTNTSPRIRPGRRPTHNLAGGGRAVLSVVTLGMIVAVSVLTAGSTRIANADHRYDPRRLVSPPVQISDDVSPLSYVEGQRHRPPTTLFTMALTGPGAQPPADGRVRLAGLDEFTGATWTVGGRFEHASSTLPPGPKLSAARTTTVVVDPRQAIPFGAFIPAYGRPVRIRGVDAYVDAATGQLIGSPELGRPVTLQVMTAQYTETDLARALPDFTFDHSLPHPIPTQLLKLAAEIAAPAATPYQRLGAILKRVKAIPYDTKAPPGNAYYSLVSAVRHNDGNIEQHAALFVVLARLVGLPARVAVGYTLHPQPGHSLRYTVTTRDAYAWAEVPVVGRGWLSFDPIKLQSVDISKPLKTEGANNVRTGAHGGVPGNVDTSLRGVATSRHTPWWTAVSVLVGLIFAALASVGISKWILRRRRRTAGSADARIVGAWRTMLITLRDCGLPIDRSLTAQEAAGVVDVRFGASVAQELRGIAPILGAALYAPVSPNARQADQAWRHADGLARVCRARLPWWRVIVATVDPRSVVPLPAGVRLPRWRRAPVQAGVR